MDAETRPKRVARQRARASLGPIGDLESHLPDDWWRQLFNALYVKTDGDVVENDENTRRDVDMIVSATGLSKSDAVLDLCCGQGRHCLELARRGFRSVTGIDRSRYLIRLARKRAEAEGLKVTFREGDARAPRIAESSLDCVTIMGNSFGYFANAQDDAKVLKAVARALRSSGTLMLDLADGDWLRDHFDGRTWEWIDEHHFVCRERSLSSDRDRLVSREVVVHDELGVIADQFYAERLYSRDRIRQDLETIGFRNVRDHGTVESLSHREQDLGMMARRIILTADAPRKVRPAPKGVRTIDVTVLLGDPRLPDSVKRGGKFNTEDLETVEKLKDALAELKRYRFAYLDNHGTLAHDLAEAPTDLIFNLCDEGWNNDAFQELHVPALLETLGYPYTGAGPSCLGMCYDKSLVRAVAHSLDVPVPAETFVRLGDQGATLPSVFPAILKPNFGDSSVGITSHAVVNDKQALFAYLEELRRKFPGRPALVQQFLIGSEYSVGLVGNFDHGIRALPVLEVDYSRLDPALPRILGYESKWEPDSPYWHDIRYKEAALPDAMQSQLIDYSTRLFERLGCRDYARFDFRADAKGDPKLLEVNPNPGWCWDGKFNLMAAFDGLRYSDLLGMILDAASERLALQAKLAAGDLAAARRAAH